MNKVRIPMNNNRVRYEYAGSVCLIRRVSQSHITITEPPTPDPLSYVAWGIK